MRNPRARLLVPAALAVLTTGLLPTAFATVGPGGVGLGPVGLTTVLAVLPLLCVVSAVMICNASRSYRRDRAAVSVAAGPPAPAQPQAGHL